jgi:hypothetical protein
MLFVGRGEELMFLIPCLESKFGQTVTRVASAKPRPMTALVDARDELNIPRVRVSCIPSLGRYASRLMYFIKFKRNRRRKGNLR